jgi:histidine ammonia-lyase
MASEPIAVGGRLSVADARRGARAPHRIVLAPGAEERIAASSARVRRAVEDGEWVYGVTTGFGSNAVEGIPESEASRLQKNLLVSHALGVGPPFEDDVVRLTLLLRLHALALGRSGVRLELVQTLARLYENDVLAVVPSRGSVGASGDLAPLAFLALPVVGRGRVRVAGREMDASSALAAAGLKPLELSYKEGLALVNGMQPTLALCLLAHEAAERTAIAADVAAALTMEALAGRGAALDARIHESRNHPGQGRSAARMRAVVEGSRLVDAPVEAIPGKRRAPQDAYGIRCAAQVHGAVADGIAFARDVFAREIDAATDNPLVFDDDILSGGNFHGEPLGLAADHLKLCVHELGSISERRLFTLVDPRLNEGLPACLVPEPGRNSGYMIPQYVAAALVSETKTLCFPSTADSIPTGANVEDHVSMATTAARRALEVTRTVQSVIALELMAAAQAIQMRERTPGPRARAVVDAVREAVPFRSRDDEWGDALERTRALVASGAVARAAGFAEEETP